MPTLAAGCGTTGEMSCPLEVVLINVHKEVDRYGLPRWT